MSGRLDNDHLTRLVNSIGSEFDNEVSLTGEEMRAIAGELKERRVADLSPSETESLRTAHAVLSDSQLSAWGSLDEKRASLMALTRVIARCIHTHDTEHKP